MAYDLTHLTLHTQFSGLIGGGAWLYDTVDTNATVYAAGYISDAKVRGMLKGDKVTVRIWTTAVPAATSELQTAAGTANILTAVYEHWVLGVDATTGAADLTNGVSTALTNS